MNAVEAKYHIKKRLEDSVTVLAVFDPIYFMIIIFIINGIEKMHVNARCKCTPKAQTGRSRGGNLVTACLSYVIVCVASLLLQAPASSGMPQGTTTTL